MRNTRSYTHIKRLLAAVLCMASLAFTACATRISTGELATHTPEPLTTPEQTQAPASRAIVVPLPEETAIINPLKAKTRDLISLCMVIFESLMSVDESGMPQCALAESYETQNGSEWTFTLRKNARWHNTQDKLNAADVIFTLDTIREIGDESIYKYVFDIIESYEERDGKLVIKTKYPCYALLSALTFPIIPKGKGYSAKEAPRIPVGTGGYRVRSYAEESSMELEANPDWWRQQPKTAALRAIRVKDTDEAISSLVYSQVDAILTDKTIVSQYSSTGVSRNIEYVTRYFEYLVMNQRTGALSSVRMRKAIAYALDKNELVSYVYINHAVVVDTPLAPDSWLYSGRTLVYENNIASAKSLIRQSGWRDSDSDGTWDTSPEGYNDELNLNLLVNNSEQSSARRDSATLIKTMLESVGINVTITALDFDAYKSALSNGTFDLALCGTYLSPLPDYSALCGTGGALNYGGYSSQSMDKAIADVKNAYDKAALQAAVETLQTLITEELPIISLYFKTHTIMTAPELMGISNVREEAGYASISQWYFE